MTDRDAIPPHEALLPCPFCGSRNVESLTHLDFVACQDCGASLEDVEPNARALWNTRAALSQREPASVGAEIGSAAKKDASWKDTSWKDDPAADERWNAGCDFALEHLAKYLNVDMASITWDGATETVEGDVQAVIGNILRAKYGEDWGPEDRFPAVNPDEVDKARAWDGITEKNAEIERLRASVEGARRSAYEDAANICNQIEIAAERRGAGHISQSAAQNAAYDKAEAASRCKKEILDRLASLPSTTCASTLEGGK